MKIANRKTILVISPFFAPHIGGSQRYIEELYARLLRTHTTLRVTVLAYNTDHTYSREIYRGMTILRIPCFHILPGQFALPHPWSLIATLISLAGQKFTIVHTHIRYFDGTWWAWAYARLIGAGSIFTEHVADHPTHPSRFVTAIGKFVDHTIASWAINRYDAVTTTNTAAKKFLRQTLGIQKPIMVSYGGVDTRFFKPVEGSVRRIPNIAKPISKKTTVISYVGRIIWSKGITHFLSAMQMLRNTPDIRFVIGGSGTLLSTVQKTIKQLGLTGRVTLTGPLTRPGVRDVLRATNIFVYPSHHNEGFPNAILEAGSSGCYVIATKNAGTAEMIENGVTGRFIASKQPIAIRDSILWALRNPRKRKWIAAECRKYIASRYDWKRVSESFYRIVQNVQIRRAADINV